MAAKNNAARVAVQAKPCRKQAASLGMVQLPTVQQGIHMACGMVADSLRMAVKCASANRGWHDEYQDSITAAEVALDIVQRLKAEMPNGIEHFSAAWWRAASVVRLARDAFPDKKAGAWFYLQTAGCEVDALYSMVEFLDLAAGQERAAA